MNYLFYGQPTGKKGRSRKYADKTNWKALDPEYFEITQLEDQTTLYSGIAYSKSLKRNIKLIAFILLMTKTNKLIKYIFHLIYKTRLLTLSIIIGSAFKLNSFIEMENNIPVWNIVRVEVKINWIFTSILL